MTRGLPIIGGLLLLLGGCMDDLDSQRMRIRDLDDRLGHVHDLDSTVGATLSTAEPESEPKTPAGERIERIVTLMKTGQPRRIALAEVTQSTIRNNLGLQSALITPAIAAARVRAERAKFESTFEASVNQGRVVSPNFYGDRTIGVIEGSTSVQPSLNVPLRSGGEVVLDWTLATENFETDGQPDQGNAVSQPAISLEQPLLRGGGFAYNEASIVIAESALGAQRSAAQLEVINQVVRAETGYWRTYQAWRTLQVNVALYETTRELLRSQRTLVEKSAGSIANVYNFEVALATAVDLVIRSELELRTTIRDLKLMMQSPGTSLDGSVALVPDTRPRLVTYDFDKARLVEFALRNRADLLQLEYERVSRSVEVVMRRNELLPELDVTAAWGFNGFDGNGRSMPEANRDLFRNDESADWSVGVSASIPIGNEAAIANYQASLLARLRSIADVRQRELTVTSEVLDAVDLMETTWDEILTARFRVEAARRFYQSYKTLFERGQIPSSNLTQALEALNTAEINQVRAEVAYQISLAELAQSVGCLLGHAGVEWQDALDIERLEQGVPNPAVNVTTSD